MPDQSLAKLIPTILLLILGLIEVFLGLYIKDKRSRNDFSVELVSLVSLPLLVQPGIFLLVFWLCDFWLPELEGILTSWPIWAMILSFLILDDMMQYWWHRWSHNSPLLWKLHRPHHVVEEMGVLVTYRNAVLYYAMMPGIWFSAFLIYFGMGYVYVVYLPIKVSVILLAHSETKWDRVLYRWKVLAPLAWLVERLISTPSTHFAHHGLTEEDGISNPNGNYGNLLFLWDVLFGTAKITRKYPKRFGAWNQIKEPWYVQLLFPLIKEKDKRSELHALRTKNDYDPSVDFKSFHR